MSCVIGVCAHGELSTALVGAMSMISGAPESIDAFPLEAGMDPLEYRKSVEEFLNLHSEDDALLLVDLLGGTPANMCASLSTSDNVEVVAGVNLGMLIEVSMMKDQMSLPQLRDLALGCGKESVVDIKALLAAKRS